MPRLKKTSEQADYIVVLTGPHHAISIRAGSKLRYPDHWVKQWLKCFHLVRASNSEEAKKFARLEHQKNWGNHSSTEAKNIIEKLIRQLPSNQNKNEELLKIIDQHKRKSGSETLESTTL